MPFSDDYCIDCGALGERLLPERFPHICERCLFPPQKQGEDPSADPPEFMPTVGLIEKLQSLQPNPSWTGHGDGWGNVGRNVNDK